MRKPKITDIPDITYVLGLDGRPRMSTTRRIHVFHLLKKGKARIAQHVPFTIQLLYKDTGVIQPLMLGIDPGRTNIGATVVREDGKVVFTFSIMRQMSFNFLVFYYSSVSFCKTLSYFAESCS